MHQRIVRNWTHDSASDGAQEAEVAFVAGIAGTLGLSEVADELVTQYRRGLAEPSRPAVKAIAGP